MALFNTIDMKKIVYLLIFSPVFILAQQESYYSLYQYNMQVINPAYAGAEAPTLFSLLNRNQWSTVENAPKTTAFTFSSARENNVGLGISVVSDKVFVEQQTFAYLDFSYHLQLDDATHLYLGIKGGGNFYNADATGLRSYGLELDPAQKVLSRFNPNVGAGMYLEKENYWLSFSIPRLFNVERDDDLAITAKDRVHTYLGAGGRLVLNEIFSLKPSVMFRKVKGLPMSVDFTGFINIKDRIDFGTSYRTNASMAVMLFLKAFKGFELGYSFETPSAQLLAGMGLKTHELVLRLKLGEGAQVVEENADNSDQ